eukprot:TRINITY_DN67550_c0_g1_i1.p1 TRINITY_DN67550_c0_g1~~TRINITY_DN67550_c0_g1_i1.p1  ORF type:complete len:282 (+),score=36.73 TRINITY_DN67550_c0_g1_i1:23-868(+)
MQGRLRILRRHIGCGMLQRQRSLIAHAMGSIALIMPVPLVVVALSPSPPPVSSCGKPPAVEHAEFIPIGAYSLKSWLPNVVLDGFAARDRAQWLMKNKGLGLDEARVFVMRQFPDSFGKLTDANVSIGEQLLYFCTDGYAQFGLCEDAAFEQNVDYWLADDDNIPAPSLYNEFHGDSTWTDGKQDGSTFYWGNVASSKACCELCTHVPSCRFFSYNTDPTVDLNPSSGSGLEACYLKAGNRPSREIKEGVTSGFPTGSVFVTCGVDGKFIPFNKCVKLPEL